jgi:hypothetical protein
MYIPQVKIFAKVKATEMSDLIPFVSEVDHKKKDLFAKSGKPVKFPALYIVGE